MLVQIHGSYLGAIIQYYYLFAQVVLTLAVGSSFMLALRPFQHCFLLLFVFQSLITSQHYKMLQVHLLLPCSSSGINLFPRSSGSLHWMMVFRDQNSGSEVCLLLLGCYCCQSLSEDRARKCMQYTSQCTCTSVFHIHKTKNHGSLQLQSSNIGFILAISVFLTARNLTLVIHNNLLIQSQLHIR